MIQDEREYRITSARAETFTRALKECEEHGAANSLLVELNRSALKSQLDDLRKDLSEYEASVSKSNRSSGMNPPPTPGRA